MNDEKTDLAKLKAQCLRFFADGQVALVPDMTRAGLNGGALAACVADGTIADLKDPETGKRLGWQITDAGRAALAQASNGHTLFFGPTASGMTQHMTSLVCKLAAANPNLRVLSYEAPIEIREAGNSRQQPRNRAERRAYYARKS